jgi:hypothetical protein
MTCRLLQHEEKLAALEQEFAASAPATVARLACSSNASMQQKLSQQQAAGTEQQLGSADLEAACAAVQHSSTRPVKHIC